MKRREGSYLTAGTISRFVFSAVMLGAFFIIYRIFRDNPSFADSYREVTKSVAMIFSGAMSYVSFTVAEFLVFLCIVLALLYLVYAIYKVFSTKDLLPRLLRIASNLLALGSALVVLFFALYGANYFCSPVSQRMGLEVREYTQQELYNLTELMLAKANEYADSVPRDMDGNCSFGNFAGMASLLPRGYSTLSEEYSFLTSTYAPVKSISTWRVLAAFGISGIYIPFTGECIVRPDEPHQVILFTMAHEIAHRLSIAPEEEANFVAFLACRANSDRRVVYSGYFMAYQFSINALYAVDADAARELNTKVNDNLAADIVQYNENIRQYDGFLSKVGNRVNDSYLRSLGQTDGTASYGKMVDLLLAEYEGSL